MFPPVRLAAGRLPSVQPHVHRQAEPGPPTSESTTNHGHLNRPRDSRAKCHASRPTAMKASIISATAGLFCIAIANPGIPGAASK